MSTTILNAALRKLEDRCPDDDELDALLRTPEYRKEQDRRVAERYDLRLVNVRADRWMLYYGTMTQWGLMWGSVLMSSPFRSAGAELTDDEMRLLTEAGYARPAETSPVPPAPSGARALREGGAHANGDSATTTGEAVTLPVVGGGLEPDAPTCRYVIEGGPEGFDLERVQLGALLDRMSLRADEPGGARVRKLLTELMELFAEHVEDGDNEHEMLNELNAGYSRDRI